VERVYFLKVFAITPKYLNIWKSFFLAKSSGVPRNFVWGGVQQMQLWTEDRENGDMGAVAP
jgi:hypothetical protein